MSNLAQVKDFHCNNCGAPLSIPNNSKGKVICPSCKTECIIEGLVKNSEILEKENINSGVSINVSRTDLSHYVLDALSDSMFMPLDILEKGSVVVEEHICVPSYLYYCNGMASFTYDAGNQREHKTAIDLGDRTRVEKETYTEWTQMSSTTAASATVVASGSREYAQVIKNLYMFYDPNNLIDVEDLELPYDVNTYSYNIPQSAAFNEHVKPYMEKVLKESAEKSLEGRNYKNLSMGGCNVQKDEIIRVSLGLYHIVYQYNGKNYSLYLSGDGSKYFWEEIPTDNARQQHYDDIIAKKNAVKQSSIFKILAIVCAVAAIFTGGISLIGTVVFGYLHFKKKKEYNEIQSQYSGEIDLFNKETADAKQAFISSGKYIKGIVAE